MHAKSIIDYARDRLAAGAWTQQLSLVPVVAALAVAVLPFTLDGRFDQPEAPVALAPETLAADTAANGLLRTGAHATARTLPDDRRYVLVAEYMARKYYVSRQVVLDLVKTAHVVGRKYNIDPTLLVAVIAVESSFNPIAESVAGAKGLMQIIPQFHQEKFTEFGGEKAVFDPHANIAVGAKIIREYLQASAGNLFTALQTYAGALPDHDASYTHKVLNEKDRLDALLGLPKTERGRVMPAAPLAAPAAPAVEQSSDRVKITLPPPAAETRAPELPRPTQPVAPASLPTPVAALRLP